MTRPRRARGGALGQGRGRLSAPTASGGHPSLVSAVLPLGESRCRPAPRQRHGGGDGVCMASRRGGHCCLRPRTPRRVTVPEDELSVVGGARWIHVTFIPRVFTPIYSVNEDDPYRYIYIYNILARAPQAPLWRPCRVSLLSRACQLPWRVLSVSQPYVLRAVEGVRASREPSAGTLNIPYIYTPKPEMAS